MSLLLPTAERLNTRGRMGDVCWNTLDWKRVDFSATQGAPGLDSAGSIRRVELIRREAVVDALRGAEVHALPGQQSGMVVQQPRTYLDVNARLGKFTIDVQCNLPSEDPKVFEAAVDVLDTRPGQQLRMVAMPPTMIATFTNFVKEMHPSSGAEVHAQPIKQENLWLLSIGECTSLPQQSGSPIVVIEQMDENYYNFWRLDDAHEMTVTNLPITVGPSIQSGSLAPRARATSTMPRRAYAEIYSSSNKERFYVSYNPVVGHLLHQAAHTADTSSSVLWEGGTFEQARLRSTLPIRPISALFEPSGSP